jgi:hypothetical protein
LAGFFYKALSKAYGEKVRIIAVTVCETLENTATYSEE